MNEPILDILKDISDRIYNEEEVTPLEVEIYCKFHHAIISYQNKNGDIKRITSICPLHGLLNVCIFDFENGKGKRTGRTSLVPSTTAIKLIESVMMMAMDMSHSKANEDTKIDVV